MKNALVTLPKSYAYLRVSTTEQDTANQKHGILEYANRNHLSGLEFIEDTVSGKTDWKQRKIGELITTTMQRGDVLIVAEVSRLGRSTLQVLDIIEHGAQRGLSIHIAKQNLVFTDKGDNMTSTIMATVLGMVAQIERQFISQRTKEALSLRKAQGVKLGRPSKPAERHKLDDRDKEIRGYLKKGMSKRSIAKLLDVAPSTLYDHLKRNSSKQQQTAGKTAANSR
jgi:DNA invertase Pin-like site-specific DNA recombinase